MRFSIKTVREKTNAIAEACICYTGDILNPNRQKFNLDYYVNLAKELEAAGAHMLAIKDMAGLCKPAAARLLVRTLRQEIGRGADLLVRATVTVALLSLEGRVRRFPASIRQALTFRSQPLR